MNELWDYIIRQINIVPQTVYEVLLSLLFIGIIVLLSLCGGKKSIRYIIGLLLSEYLFIINGITVIYRKARPDFSHFFTPFWSYRSLHQGEIPLFYEMIMNVVFFIPVGFLWGLAFSKGIRRKQWFIALLLGMGLSISIELLQLLFNKGSFEIDDVIHNTLGCLIGFALGKGVFKIKVLLKKQITQNS